MRDGDISNAMSPRLWWLWEGLVADLPPEHRAAERAFRRLHRWDRAVGQWEWNTLIEANIYDLAWRHDIRSELVTVKGDQFAQALLREIDDRNLPVQLRSFSSLSGVARAIPRSPWVQRIFFGSPELALTFGSVGRYVPNGGNGFSPLV